MEPAIKISNINDYIFCPYSIYLHNIYDSFHENVYKDEPQKKGTQAHSTIDNKKYSSSKRYLQSLSIYSHKHTIVGKIDVYDSKECALIERKRMIKQIYDGYRYQLYAQYYCLLDMGYKVKKLFLHSLVDNQRYEINLPSKEQADIFFTILNNLRNFQAGKTKFKVNKKKCAMCIYSQLCSFSKC